MNSLGRHLVVELMDCDSEILKDMGTIKDFMIRAATTAGATPVQNVFHSFNPMGISGVVVIAESHLTIHTWPEYGYAAIDVFTCGDIVIPEAAADFLKEKLRAKNISIIELKRGILSLSNKKFPHKLEGKSDERVKQIRVAV